MEGTSSTVGMINRVNTILKEDSLYIKCIKNSGMIPFVKTNLPQLAFSFEAYNAMWGRCLNPWNVKKVPGGSSSG